MLLETERLYLREFKESDGDALVPIFGDPKVMEFSVKGLLTPEETKQKLLEWIIPNYAKHGFGLWAVIRKDNEQLIGYAGITMQIVDDKECEELGYRLASDEWGKGFATEACLAVKEYAFNELKLDKLISIIEEENSPSVKVAKKIGMGFSKKAVFHGIDVAIYEVLNDRSRNRK